MPLFDSVPRDLYDRKCAEYDALLEKYHALKLAGAALPPEPKPGRVVEPRLDPEAVAAQRMHDELIERLSADLEHAAGVDPALAKAEAARIREQAFGKGMTP
jgi:hypothetical protein